MHAEQQRDHRHHQQREHAAADAVGIQEDVAEEDHDHQAGKIQPDAAPAASRGLPPILADSLPKAMIEPENVTAPMKMPM